MNEKEVEQFLELAYQYILKRMKSDGILKNTLKSVNATVSWIDTNTSSNIGKIVRVKFPYDSNEIEVINKSSVNLAVGDLVCLHYCIDLKNSYVAYKV